MRDRIKKTKPAAIIIVVVGLSAIALYALFHGYFDHGHFEVKRTASSPDGKLAIVAERWDNNALSGNQYFVLIDDRVPSPREVRYAYYHGGLIFRAGSDCLTLTWQDKDRLVISCADGLVNAQEIAVQKDQWDGVAIAYDRIPRKTGVE